MFTYTFVVDPSLVSRTTPNQSEELFYLSTITGNFLPQLGPRLTVRRRGVGVLPTVANSADDLDNLDDVRDFVAFKRFLFLYNAMVHQVNNCVLNIIPP